MNISSVAARLGPPAEAAYAASKAAITAWSESMQVDLGIAGSAVKVHVVNPGVFDTELFHLPDNDDFTAAVEMLPVESIVEPDPHHDRRRARSSSTCPSGSARSRRARRRTPARSSSGSIAYMREENTKAAG